MIFLLLYHIIPVLSTPFLHSEKFSENFETGQFMNVYKTESEMKGGNITD